MPKHRSIRIQGARTHNLKNISCEIPHGVLTVITGPSGSGKSSLAFDTLYAEGQRRFMESMSTYARQFLERIEKPDVDQIQHILPTIALEQKNHIKNARSTVGTATEIYDFLRVLFATVGTTYCDTCDGVVSKATPHTIEADLKNQPEGTKIILTAQVSLKAYPVETLIQQGYFRAYWQESLIDLNEGLPKAFHQAELDIVIDRLVLKGDKTPSRFSESIRKALEVNPHQIKAYFVGENSEALLFDTQFSCQSCHKIFEAPFPNLFSFNSPLGACKACEGFGKIIGLDLNKVIPNRQLSLEEGAIHPFNMPSAQEMYDDLMREGKKRRIRLTVPFEELTADEKAFVFDGAGRYEGIYQFFEWLESKKYKVHVRVMLAKYRGYYPCPECYGSRLRKEALNVKLNKKSIDDLCQLPITALFFFFKNLPLAPYQQEIAHRLLREIQGRLEYLVEIGLGYLTLARQSRTLSGGEAQRINLSSALGTALTDTLYVLDEPTVGLHARDTQRLLSVLKVLRDYGNTVVVVEHDPEMILGADRILDLGPTGGQEGGHVVYEGSPSGLLKTSTSQTAYYLNHPPQIELRPSPSEKKTAWMEIVGAYGNNLKHIDVKLPKNQLVCISGVSGSGKSTLIKQTLYANYQQSKGHELNMEAAPYIGLNGFEEFKEIVLVDQSPPGRSVRSNPVTYVKAYDEIRKLFAGTRQAQALGITASHFSFNSKGGRCETCEGLGFVTIDMQFMADVTVVCQDCQGKRFSPAVLAIEFDGKNINNVLDMTVNEALSFFQRHNRVVKKLLPLAEIGLGYLHLGQSTASLSGGEAQRLKLASYLFTSDAQSQSSLFLFDEPTTGLHLTDIQTLITALRKLLAAGHSIIVVEHNIEFLAQADYLIDLGPEGGEKGGQVVAEGSPAQVMENPLSVTGQFIKQRVSASQEMFSLKTAAG